MSLMLIEPEAQWVYSLLEPVRLTEPEAIPEAIPDLSPRLLEFT